MKIFGLVILLFFTSLFVNAQNCTINAGVDVNLCPGDNIVLNGAISGLYNGSSISWSQVSGPSVTISTPTSLTTNAGVATGSSIAAVQYVFQIQGTCLDGTTISDQVTFTVSQLPPIPPVPNAGSSPINAGCVLFGNSISLNATAATSGFEGTWIIVSGGQGTFSDIHNPSATFTPVQDGYGNPNWVCKPNTNTYVLAWTLKSTQATQCSQATPVSSATVTINASLYNNVDATVNPPNCSNQDESTRFYGSCTGDGTSFWTLVSGPAGYTFAGSSSQDMTLNLSPGNYTFRYSVSGTCITGSKDVSFIVSYGAIPVTASTANAGNIETGYCNNNVPSSLKLGANTPALGETGTWTQVGGGNQVNFSDVHDPNAVATGLSSAGLPYTFRWTITNGTGCYSYSDVVLFSPTDLSMPNINFSTGCGEGLYPQVVPSGGICSPQGGYVYVKTISIGSIPLNSGWTLKGYILDSKPYGSPAPLGYVPGGPAWLATPPYTYGGDVCAVNGLSFSLTWAMGLTSLIKVNIQTKPMPGVYSGTLYFENKICGTTVGVPFNINLSLTPSNSNAGTDQNLACGVTSTYLQGNDPTLTTPHFGKGTWYQVSGPNTANIVDIHLINTQITNLISGTYQFKWEIFGGDRCPAKEDIVVVRVSDNPPLPVSAGSNTTVCNGAPVTLTASVSPSGNLANMLNTTGSIGTWSYISSNPSSASPNILAPNEITTSVSGLVAGVTYTFQYTAQNACGSQSSTVQVTVSNDVAPSPSDAGVNQCLALGVSSTALNAVNPAIGTGVWTALSSNPSATTFGSPSSNQTTVTGLSNAGVYGFIYTVSNGSGCSDSKDTVYVSNTGPVTLASSASTISLCGSGAGANIFTLTGNVPTNGTGVWSQVSGPSVAIFDPNTPITNVTVSADGQYIFRWKISNGVCQDSYTDVRVNIYTKPTLASILTQNTKLCASTGGVVTLQASPVTNGVGVWSIVNNAPANISSPSSSTTSATVSPGTTTFKWTVSPYNSAVCASSSDQVTVTYIPPANAKSDIRLCKATSALLQANSPGVGTGAWSVVAQPVGSPSVNFVQQGNDSTFIASPLSTGVYTFRWTITDNSATNICSTTADDLNVTIDDLEYPNAGTDACSVVGGSISLTGSAIPTGGSALWTVFSSPTGATGTFTSPTSNNANYGTFNVSGFYNFQYQVSKGACSLHDFTQVKVVSASAAGSDIDQCNNSSFTMAANDPSITLAESGTWTLVSGTATITTPTSATTTVTGIPVGTSAVLKWAISIPEGCSSSSNVSLTNKPEAPVASASASTTDYCDNTDGLDLNGNDPSPGTGSWSVVSQPSGSPAISWTNQNSQNANVKNLGIGSYTFRYTIDNAPCTPTTSDVTINSTCSLLPIILIAFNLSYNDCSVKIGWKTGFEENFNHFEVQRSDDGVNFISITRVNGKGNNSNYEYLDKNIDKGVKFYRLKEVDRDGKYNYSQIRNVEALCTNISILPTLAHDRVTINGLEGNEIINVYDMTGRLVRSLRSPSANNYLSLDISTLSSATYKIQVRKSGKMIFAQNIIKY